MSIRTGDRHTHWMNRYLSAKAWLCFRGLLPRILGSSSQFHEIQIGGWPMEVLHMVKTRTIRKWKLNTCDNFVNLGTKNFFVGRHRSKIYTM